jgi:hypothetical protein
LVSAEFSCYISKTTNKHWNPNPTGIVHEGTEEEKKKKKRKKKKRLESVAMHEAFDKHFKVQTTPQWSDGLAASTLLKL